MREEITEPRHWRSAQEGSGNRLSRSAASLKPTAVDEAFAMQESEAIGMRGSRRACAEVAPAEPAPSRTLHSEDIVQSLSQQLAMLEAQREQLSRLLDQARGN